MAVVIQKNIVIVGAGEIGKALGGVLKQRYHNVALWDVDASKMPEPVSLPTVLPTADIVFFCVPSWAIRQATTASYNLLKKDAVVVSLAKGIEENSNKTMDELLTELLPSHQTLALLSGPMLAEEIERGLPAYGVVGTELEQTFLLINELFLDSTVSLGWQKDMRGVALSGVLKNIYTFAIGFAVGLELGSDVKGQIVTQAIKEMSLIVEKLGGKKDTVLTSAGLGDFIATSFSSYSRNLQTSLEIINSGKWEQRSEGLVSLGPLLRRLAGDTKDLPLLRALALIILDKENPRRIFTEAIKRL